MKHFISTCLLWTHASIAYAFTASTFCCCLMFLMPLSFTALHAQDKIWDGGAGTNSWMDAANWAPDGVPDASQFVRIIDNKQVVIPSGTVAVARYLEVWIASQLTVEEDASLLLNSGVSNGRLNLDDSPTVLTNYGTITIANADHYGIRLHANPHLINHGVITLTNVGNISGIEMNPGRITNNGVLTISQTSGTADGIYLIGASTVTNNETGKITISGTGGDAVSSSGFFNNYGSFEAFDMTRGEPLIEAEVGMVFYNYPTGSVKGYGEIHNASLLDMGGDISPGITSGNPAGIIFFAGGDEEFTSGTMTIEIAGTAGPGLSGGYDQVKVIHGEAVFEPEYQINISLLNDYVPQEGDNFTIMSYLSRSGNPTINLPPLPNGYAWNLDIGETGIKAEVMQLLPVTLTDFNAKTETGMVILSWQTASEYNNAGFMVEYSGNGATWRPIDFVNGSGNSTTEKNYQFIHYHPNPGMNYYRLRQMDFDGSEKVSPVAAVRFAGEVNNGLLLYPNPAATGEITITLQSPELTEGALSIFSMTGQQIVSRKDVTLPAKMSLDALIPGIYIVLMEAKDSRQYRSKLFIH